MMQDRKPNSSGSVLIQVAYRLHHHGGGVFVFGDGGDGAGQVFGWTVLGARD